MQDLDLCTFTAPFDNKGKLFDLDTELDGGRIKYVLRHK